LLFGLVYVTQNEYKSVLSEIAPGARRQDCPRPVPCGAGFLFARLPWSSRAIAFSRGQSWLFHTSRRHRGALKRHRSSTPFSRAKCLWSPVSAVRCQMFDRNEWWRKRYAEDPAFREKIAVRKRVYNQKHQSEIQERHRQRMRGDPEYRERTKTTSRRSK